MKGVRVSPLRDKNLGTKVRGAQQKETTCTGFEPMRNNFNGFQVHRLNHSANMSI